MSVELSGKMEAKHKMGSQGHAWAPAESFLGGKPRHLFSSCFADFSALSFTTSACFSTNK